MRYDSVPRPWGDDAGREAPEAEPGASDQELMEGVRDGSALSLRILMQRYWSPLVGYASAIADSPDDAEDVVQDVFVRVWRQRAKWTPSGAVNAYLYRITRNLVLNARRDVKARRGKHERGGAVLLGAASTRSPDRDFEAGSLRAEIDGAIAALPERRREVFVLSRFHGMTHQEIAQTLGLSPQTVANHMSIALADLRKSLSQHLHER